MNEPIYQRKDYKIIQHLHYMLMNVDGLVWLLTGENYNPRIDITFRDRIENKPLSYGQVSIAIGEAGLINTRKLYQFLGLTTHPKKHHLVESQKRFPEDVDITDLDNSEKITTNNLLAAWHNDPIVITAVTHTLLAVNKGVAHFTVDGVEGARRDYTLITAQVGLLLVEERVQTKNYPLQDYRFWTKQPVPGSALPPGRGS